jgi:hypothetical protein
MQSVVVPPDLFVTVLLPPPCSALQQQLAFSTALLLDWCGVAPAGSAELVLQELVQ